jgi:hypothetical protein
MLHSGVERRRLVCTEFATGWSWQGKSSTQPERQYANTYDMAVSSPCQIPLPLRSEQFEGLAITMLGQEPFRKMQSAADMQQT